MLRVVEEQEKKESAGGRDPKWQPKMASQVYIRRSRSAGYRLKGGMRACV